MPKVHSQTVFLFGAGAVEDPWAPIISAIQEHHPEARVQDGQQANHYLAWWVYAQRLRARRIEKGGLSPEKRAELDRLKDDDDQLREGIAKHLVRATVEKTYQLRRRFVEVVGQPRWKQRGGALYLTTNWDRLPEVTMAVPEKSVVHLHGDVSSPTCIYLPTETAHEAHRSREANDHIGLLTGTAWQVIQGTDQLCIYGLSFSPLDAELSWVVRVGLEGHTRESMRIYVFDLRAELPKLEWRIRLLLPPGQAIAIEKHAVDEDALVGSSP